LPCERSDLRPFANGVSLSEGANCFADPLLEMNGFIMIYGFMMTYALRIAWLSRIFYPTLTLPASTSAIRWKWMVSAWMSGRAIVLWPFH